jgi:hypothetical protein
VATDEASKHRWSAILDQAAAIVRSYATGVTLRQLFYRLVAAEVLPNTVNSYKALSSKTAAARRDGWFPALIDRTRTIHRFQTFDGPEQAQGWLSRIYRRDRTKGQKVALYLGVEKSGIVEQLEAWFGNLGIPILALGGYSSQSYVDEVVADVSEQDRPAVLIYAGDHDPSGEDIDRDFVARAGCFDDVVRVALSAAQVVEHDLPPQPGKEGDSRARGFLERHGELRQVELDALPPNVLRELYEAAVDQFWDASAFEKVMQRERADRELLVAALEEDR